MTLYAGWEKTMQLETNLLGAAATLTLNCADNVLIARRALLHGTDLGSGLVTVNAVPAGHKVARRLIQKGEPVLRYGQVIGFATSDIQPGSHVHLQNMAMGEFEKDYAFSSAVTPTQYVDTPATFMGIRRPDGRAATRNYVGILSTVNCSSHVAELVADVFRKNPFKGDDPLSAYPNVDGVVALTHKSGCGMTSGEPLRLLRRTMGGYARHVNFSHVVVLGLGCEVNQVGGLLEEQGLAGRVRSMDIQTMGGARRTVEAAVSFVREVLEESNRVTREPIPASELVVGLQCGGSDGLSGVTANPALGAASDILVRHGGTVILSETPETFGAEHLLTRRAVSREVGERLLKHMAWWESYFQREGAVMNDNRSPGNMAGGISTIVEKSLGAMAKAGTTNLVEVVGYAEPVRGPGFVFMDTPGYDPVSATGQVAGGANLICFTTGRGSVFGCKPSPTIKLASNTPMYTRMQDDMDVNCGEVITGAESVEECGQRIFDLMLDVASGTPSKSESFDFGANEFAPWVLGATV